MSNQEQIEAMFRAVLGLCVGPNTLDGTSPLWADLNMLQAMEHASKRIPLNTERPVPLEFDFDVVQFTDGTALAVRSHWSGPYSRETPDIDADNPVWKVYIKGVTDADTRIKDSGPSKQIPGAPD